MNTGFFSIDWKKAPSCPCTSHPHHRSPGEEERGLSNALPYSIAVNLQFDVCSEL